MSAFLDSISVSSIHIPTFVLIEKKNKTTATEFIFSHSEEMKTTFHAFLFSFIFLSIKLNIVNFEVNDNTNQNTNVSVFQIKYENVCKHTYVWNFIFLICIPYKHDLLIEERIRGVGGNIICVYMRGVLLITIQHFFQTLTKNFKVNLRKLCSVEIDWISCSNNISRVCLEVMILKVLHSKGS